MSKASETIGIARPSGAREVDRCPVEKHFHERKAVEPCERGPCRERAASAARDLHEAKTPAAALGYVFLQSFGGEPVGQRLV